MRAPARMRARMSRPSSSRPNGCVELGRARRSARSWLAGSNSAIAGPIKSAAALTITMIAPTANSVERRLRETGRGTSFIADSRIEEPVQDVHQQVHRDIGDGDEQNAPLHRGVITRADRLNEQSAHTRPAENRLGDYRFSYHAPAV